MPNKITVFSLPSDIVNDSIYSINQSNPNSYTHGMFKYPCKFIPEIPRWCINKYSNRKTIVFDPFAGSGTTLLEANILGLDAFGTEIDDIAKLIIKVKTSQFSKNEIKDLQRIYNNIISKDIKKNNYFRPEINNLEHWFSDDAIKKLGFLHDVIQSIENPKKRDFFKLVFVSIIKKVSNADDTSPKPYVSKRIIKNPPETLSEFSITFTKYLKMVQDLASVQNFGVSTILDGDALNFKIPKKLDLVITSPPYINAFDYGRTLRLENLWLNMLSEEELRDRKKSYVGTEKISIKKEEASKEILKHSKLLYSIVKKLEKKDKRRALIVKKFFDDMEKNLCIVSKNMKIGGKYIIVIGNSNIRETLVESWKIIKEISEWCGFVAIEHFSYEIHNPYIRIPRNGRGGVIKNDHVIVLERRGEIGTR